MFGTAALNSAIFLPLGIEGMRWLVIVWLMLSLTACAMLTATGLESEFVGRSVSEAVAKVGPPTTKSQLGNGRMAFEWLHYGPCTYSAMATSDRPDSQSLADWKIETWNATADCEASASLDRVNGTGRMAHLSAFQFRRRIASDIAKPPTLLF